MLIEKKPTYLYLCLRWHEVKNEIAKLNVAHVHFQWKWLGIFSKDSCDKHPFVSMNVCIFVVYIFTQPLCGSTVCRLVFWIDSDSQTCSRLFSLLSHSIIRDIFTFGLWIAFGTACLCEHRPDPIQSNPIPVFQTRCELILCVASMMLQYKYIDSNVINIYLWSFLLIVFFFAMPLFHVRSRGR